MMRRPSPHTMLIGQPVIATTVQLFGGGMAILCAYVGVDALIPGLLACFLVAQAARAAEAVQAYERWVAICAEVDGVPVRRRPPLLSYARWIVAGLILLLLVGLLSQSDNAAPTIGWVIGLALLAILVRLVRRVRRRRQRPAKPTTVQVVASCVMAPVPLDQAFALLPSHCQRILTRPHP